MKTLVSHLIRILRFCFYNTPVKNWRLTEWIYARVGRLLVGSEAYPLLPFHGLKLKTNGADGIMTTALVNGNYEPVTLGLFETLIREIASEGPCAIADVGANIGVFTLVAATFGSAVQIVAFEPNPLSYRLLCDNVELNELKNVTTIEQAVGSGPGTASLDISSPSAGMHSIHGTGDRRIEVPVVSLDDYFTSIPPPRLIKIDVEGFEPTVFLGMKSILQTPDLLVLLEFNPEHLKRGGKNPSDFIDELSLLFAAIYCIDEIAGRPVPLSSGNSELRRRLLSVGYNLLAVKGRQPRCLPAPRT